MKHVLITVLMLFKFGEVVTFNQGFYNNCHAIVMTKPKLSKSCDGGYLYLLRDSLCNGYQTEEDLLVCEKDLKRL